MIELIFVIVILGILAAVAIPRLTATRDDAKITTLTANAATILQDAGAYYTGMGEDNWAGGTTVPTWTDITNVQLYTAAGTPTSATAITTEAFLYTDGTANGEQVLGFIGANDGNFTIQQGSGTGAIVTGVWGLTNKLTDGANDKTHEFGGTQVVR